MEAAANSVPRWNATDSPCKCDNDHKTQLEYEMSYKEIMHLDIVDNLCRPNKIAFHTNKTLLALHSGSLKGKVAEIEHQGAQRISLPEVNACQFAEFICWIRSYHWAPVLIHGDLDCLRERLWQLGSLLKAPSFQNAAMDDIRRWCKDSKTKGWPDRKDIDLIYRLTTPGAKLRRFAADSVACRNPFEKYREGEEAYKSWEQLFKNWPALMTEVANAAEEEWNGTYPWDDENRE